jgi:hypothetical protein
VRSPLLLLKVIPRAQGPGKRTETGGSVSPKTRRSNCAADVKRGSKAQERRQTEELPAMYWIASLIYGRQCMESERLRTSVVVLIGKCYTLFYGPWRPLTRTRVLP